METRRRLPSGGASWRLSGCCWRLSSYLSLRRRSHHPLRWRAPGCAGQGTPGPAQGARRGHYRHNRRVHLQYHRISYTSYKYALGGLRAIEAGEIEALIFNAPILRYLIHHELKGGALRFCRSLSTVKITASPYRKAVHWALSLA